MATDPATDDLTIRSTDSNASFATNQFAHNSAISTAVKATHNETLEISNRTAIQTAEKCPVESTKSSAIKCTEPTAHRCSLETTVTTAIFAPHAPAVTLSNVATQQPPQSLAIKPTVQAACGTANGAAIQTTDKSTDHKTNSSKQRSALSTTDEPA